MLNPYRNLQFTSSLGYSTNTAVRENESVQLEHAAAATLLLVVCCRCPLSPRGDRLGCGISSLKQHDCFSESNRLVSCYFLTAAGFTILIYHQYHITSYDDHTYMCMYIHNSIDTTHTPSSLLLFAHLATTLLIPRTCLFPFPVAARRRLLDRSKCALLRGGKL